MAQERRSSQRSGGRVIGLPGQRRGALPKYGELDWQTLPLDSATAQWFWQQFGATEPNAPDTAAVAQPTPVQQDTVPPPPPSLQQTTGIGAQAANTGTGTPPSATPTPSPPPPAPGVAQKGATKMSPPQQALQNTYQLALASQQAQRMGIESAMQPVSVPEPVGAQIESGLTPDYTADLRNLIQQWLSMPFQQQGFHLWAAVPTTSGLDARILLWQGLQFLKERLPQLSERDAQLVSLWADDERFKDALLQESRRLLEEAIARTPAASHYQNLVKILKQQEEELRRELLSIPPEKRVMVNQHFVDLYNRYLQVQNNIMNAAALAAANQGWRINWQNLLDRAAANFFPSVWRILQNMGLKVPVEQAVDDALWRLWNMAKNSDNPHLQRALQYLEEIRKYGGQNLTLWDSARITELHSEYIAALRQAGLNPETVNSLASVVTKIGTLPGLGWSSGPIVEPAQPIIGFLQPAQLGSAQLPNVEAPVPTSRGGGGGARRTSRYLLNVETVGGLDRPVIDASDRLSLVNSFAERENIAGTTYIPYEDYGSWSRLAYVASRGKSGARIQIGNVVFDLAQARKDPQYWNTFVNNISKVLTEKQNAGAYTRAVDEIDDYLATLAASGKVGDSASALEEVRRFFLRNRSLIGRLIYNSVADPPSLWTNFLRQLSQRNEARTILQHLRNPAVQEAVRMALIGGIVRYISRIHGAVTINGETIKSSEDPNLKMGIIGLLLGNLFKIVRL